MSECSIITVESTDISTQKHLCVFIRFLSRRRKEIVTRFMGLIGLERLQERKCSILLMRK